jgi:general secretion pathway protein I
MKYAAQPVVKLLGAQYMLKNKFGFTLIEVLIALAIISIALTAIIKATAQNTRDTLYIQNKTIANWVGAEIMNEARLELIKPPFAPDKLSEEMVLLNQRWKWEAQLKNTHNARIKEIDVTVFQRADEKKSIHLVSYLYVEK